ncbi:hypothetical protein Syun_009616 [Stephania yunnanensis]|uniref:BHLH domain-containing protein n=1 Tax=Stephania yunnanensis TaxID=152371 RepID=A0AAP0KHC2_9MAGN
MNIFFFCWRTPFIVGDLAGECGYHSIERNNFRIFKDEEKQWKDAWESTKRGRLKSCATLGKACREKMRRDKLNDRFFELCSFLEQLEKPPKIDKMNILRLTGVPYSEHLSFLELKEFVQVCFYRWFGVDFLKN